jgi:hypothetical protein
MNTTKRMTIRLAPEDEQWLATEAADEGLDPAAMVRVILARLRQGRPALYREALALARAPVVAAAQRVLARHPLNPMMPAPMPRVDVSGEVVEPVQPVDEALDAMEAQSEAEEYGEPPPLSGVAAAFPLKLVARQKYNPGVR